jgi:predicted phage baseplate assembly protein
VAVTNPIPTWGAAAGETVADAEKRIPGWLRHRNVLATQQDYREIARATPGVAIGRVEVLALTHPDLPGQVSEGVVTVLVIPATDSREPDAPTPDRLFLQTVCAHLEPRRILTTELHIRGPDYQPIAVGVGIRAVPGEPEGPLAERVRAALLRFLSPLAGGFEQTGWPLRKAVEAAELQAAAARERGVAQVSGLVLARADGTALPNGLSIAGLQLPKVTAVVVTIGAPPTLGEIFGEAPPATEPAALPVPVAPEEC